MARKRARSVQFYHILIQLTTGRFFKHGQQNKKIWNGNEMWNLLGGGSESLLKTKLKGFPFCFAAKCYIFASAVGGVSVETLLKNPAERRTLVRCLLDVRERVPMTFQTDNTSNSLAQSTGSRPSGGDGWWVIKVRQMNLPTERQSSR